MHWPPNSEGISWFAESSWPRIAKAVPRSVLTVIGKRPPARLLHTVSNGRVEITGYISDPEAFLTQTAAFIVPLQTGAGMRVKILDAWSWGLPVVSTSVGAQGIRAVPGENLLLADEEDSFAECVIQVLRNTKLAHRLAENGRATVESFYDWRKAYRAWDQVYN
jgi:glycosyltransferase involved in cell wall biosynthesis